MLEVFEQLESSDFVSERLTMPSYRVRSMGRRIRSIKFAQMLQKLISLRHNIGVAKNSLILFIEARSIRVAILKNSIGKAIVYRILILMVSKTTGYADLYFTLTTVASMMLNLQTSQVVSVISRISSQSSIKRINSVIYLSTHSGLYLGRDYHIS